MCISICLAKFSGHHACQINRLILQNEYLQIYPLHEATQVECPEAVTPRPHTPRPLRRKGGGVGCVINLLGSAQAVRSVQWKHGSVWCQCFASSDVQQIGQRVSQACSQAIIDIF